MQFGIPISRRQIMRMGVVSAAAMLAGGPRLSALGDVVAGLPGSMPSTRPSKAKAVIQIWMWGGPAHTDTFDPKPEAGQDYTGPLTKPIETNVSGIRISELLPLLAKHADKYALIRSMTHGNNGHETAAYMVQTGRPPGGRDVYPSVGAVVALFKAFNAGYSGLIPPYIVLTQPQGRFSEAGFLGSKYKPFATGGDPGGPRFNVEGVVAEGITEQRQHDRRELLHTLNTLSRAMPNDPRLKASSDAEQRAYDLILGDAGKVFDLSQEKDDVRTKYGKSTFGQACLVARRLVERGVPYVTINAQGWDTHKQHFQAMRQKLPQVDSGLSSLFEDLAARGLLDSTVIWCCGEFGRTPKVQWEAPWNGGRGHFGKVFSALVAGGGFKGGQVVGSSNATGEEVKDRPVYPIDLIASIYDRLGIDGNAKLPHPQGSDTRVLPQPDEKAPTGGILREIMS